MTKIVAHENARAVRLNDQALARRSGRPHAGRTTNRGKLATDTAPSPSATLSHRKGVRAPPRIPGLAHRILRTEHD